MHSFWTRSFALRPETEGRYTWRSQLPRRARQDVNDPMLISTMSTDRATSRLASSSRRRPRPTGFVAVQCPPVSQATPSGPPREPLTHALDHQIGRHNAPSPRCARSARHGRHRPAALASVPRYRLASVRIAAAVGGICMERQNILLGNPYEEIVGFSRAVKVGPLISVGAPLPLGTTVRLWESVMSKLNPGAASRSSRRRSQGPGPH